MISRSKDTPLIPESQHPSLYEMKTGQTELSLDTIANLPNELYWDTVALMSFNQIRKLVNPVVTDDEIIAALSKRFMECTFWHHLSESKIRSILDTIVDWHGNNGEEISPEKVAASVAEDVEFITMIREQHNLKGDFTVDNSLLYEILQDYPPNK